MLSALVLSTLCQCCAGTMEYTIRDANVYFKVEACDIHCEFLLFISCSNNNFRENNHKKVTFVFFNFGVFHHCLFY